MKRTVGEVVSVRDAMFGVVVAHSLRGPQEHIWTRDKGVQWYFGSRLTSKISELHVAPNSERILSYRYRAEPESKAKW